VNASRQYLLQRPFKDDKTTDITFIEYLRDNRIDLNTIFTGYNILTKHYLFRVYPFTYVSANQWETLEQK
jgi:hypothetical protein